MPHPPHALEDQLADLTREFVARLVEAIRNASLADVAALPGATRAPQERAASTSRLRRLREPATPPKRPASVDEAAADAPTNGRQTAVRRAELGQQLTQALSSARQPMGVRALATSLGVDPGLLAVPLRELRAAGKIRKHGEKRATTYSLA